MRPRSDRLAEAGKRTRRAWKRTRPRLYRRVGRPRRTSFELAATLKKQLDRGAHRPGHCPAQGRVPARRRACLWHDPGTGKEAAGSRGPGRHRSGMVEEAVTPDHIAAWSSRAGPASRSTRCWQASATSCCAWKSDLAPPRRRPGRGSEGRVNCGAPRASRPAGPEPPDRHRSCSSAQPASARPS